MTEKRQTNDAKRLEQLERFKRAARALCADEDEAAFKAKLAVIARQKPKSKPNPKKPKDP